MRVYGPKENLTLTEADLRTARVRKMGSRLRGFCPFHGSDRQRSLSIKEETGSFRCFACGAWGYTETARAVRKAERSSSHPFRTEGYVPRKRSFSGESSSPRSSPPDPHPRPVEDLEMWVLRYLDALGGSLGERYLRHRGIRPETARRHGVGYAAPGQWAHRDGNGRPVRQGRYGRLVFPHTSHESEVVNLYGRAVESAEKIPKGERHDHLAGPKGVFNGRAFVEGEGPLFVCEGAFDALSLIEAGYPRTVAIFGINGMRWEWTRNVTEVVIALDHDETGRMSRLKLGREGALRGKRVWFLEGEALGGAKDLNEAWVQERLRMKVGAGVGAVG